MHIGTLTGCPLLVGKVQNVLRDQAVGAEVALRHFELEISTASAAITRTLAFPLGKL
jgi:hypothetical protein